MKLNIAHPTIAEIAAVMPAGCTVLFEEHKVLIVAEGITFEHITAAFVRGAELTVREEASHKSVLEPSDYEVRVAF